MYFHGLVGTCIAMHSIVDANCLVSLTGYLKKNRARYREVAAMKARFSRKLHLAFGVMLAVTFALAWYFYDSVQWFEHDVRRITYANSVLNGYQVLASQSTQKINLIEDSVAGGEIHDLAAWQENIRLLRSSLNEIRQALVEENTLRDIEGAAGNLEVLDEIEVLIESIVASGEAIQLAMDEQDVDSMLATASDLRNSGITQVLQGLMSEALASRVRELEEANSESVSLARYITGVLPLFMLMLVGITVTMTWFFSRSLTRSVNVLREGAHAFTNDDLSHRIPELDELEFERLAEAFNAMARQLADHRAAMRDSNIRLEAIVEERTRALKSSNEILELADENRRKLLADISHEFRTPLTVIRGESEIALRGKAKTKAEYQETLARIMEQADQTTRLVDDLLFIARADAGEPRLTIRSVSVGSVLSATCDDFSAKAEQNEINIELALGQGSAVVMGDAGRLRQVFSILLDNALRYSNAGETIEVGLVRNKNDIVVTVRDSGIGLTREESRQAFQRFFRGGKAQAHARGTGLGLPVAKAIVEAHKGQITLEGKPGEGALATVILPAEEKLKAVA